MKYDLNTEKNGKGDGSAWAAVKKLLPLLADEKKNLIYASLAIFFSSLLTLIGPFLIGHTIDTYVVSGDYRGVLAFSGILLAVYIGAFAASYLQTQLMGAVGQRTLFRLRNAVFKKLQELPLSFFNQNKAGDLISRINNDTEKLNQFFSQGLMQFISNVFIIIGAGVFLLMINFRLGAAALAPAALLYVFSMIVSGWIKRKNAASLQAVGNLSAEIQESVDNFKVVVAFDRRDYFRTKFGAANRAAYEKSLGAGIANNVYIPVYGLVSNLAQMITLAFGVYLIATGSFTIGLLISYLSYINRFYDPLRQIASIWSTFQVALAGWDRISAIFSLNSDMAVIPDAGADAADPDAPVLEFRNVGFAYENTDGKPGGTTVLHDVNFALERGRTYALVGPTGGGKTTTASLMARLYDPTSGTVLLDGRDIRSFKPDERTRKIGFILQEPYLFTGTIRDNIVYGNDSYARASDAELESVLKNAGLGSLLGRFEQGLATEVSAAGDTMSLGQRQLVAFIRAALLDPEILILDEATANIDTVTEKLLEEILAKISKKTTRVIIAHRLNTIENADEIFFVNGGEIRRAGSFSNAVDMLLHHKRES